MSVDETKPRVELKSVKLVAAWEWKAPRNDPCTICQNLLEDCCRECTIPGEGCPVATGVCTHTFHIHCIEGWLKSKAAGKCPICRRGWHYK